jgi:hypothetical protein
MISYPEGHLCPLVGLRSGKFEDPRRMRHIETPLTSAAAETDPSRAGPGTSCQATFIQSLRDKAKPFLG